MPRYRLVNGEKIQFTAEEEKARDAEEKAFQAEYADRFAPLNYLREERNLLLAKTDWWASADLTMTDAQKKYRQDLRDITKTYKSLDDVKWPTEPTS
tara:strand:+ start:3320 stop:3610 length:291 start_codon:yes stop_codon:yes gene_type:complete